MSGPTKVGEIEVSPQGILIYHLDGEDLGKLSRILRELGIKHEVKLVWCG